MFVAIHAEDNTRVTSIAARWNSDLETLRELAASGKLVCPGCSQHLWLRVGKKRRRHFAHRSLADCPLADQSVEVLEAKAQLFTWLETKYPDRVHLDMEVEESGWDRPLDILVNTENGGRFGYFIFDRQQRFREELLARQHNTGLHLHFIHTASTLKRGSGRGLALTASQRDFMERSDFDTAIERYCGGHLHFFLGETSEMCVYRGLHCVHSPNLYQWEVKRRHPLSKALISPRTGEIVFAKDVAARQKWKDKSARIKRETPVVWSDRNALGHQPDNPPPQVEVAIVKPPAPEPEATEKGPNLNGPFCCEDCGIMTTAWSQARPSEGTCVCRSCVNKRPRGGA